MADVTSMHLEAEWDWQTEDFAVTGHVTFMFGATRYRLAIEQHVQEATALYNSVADQVEHIFIDVAAALGKLNNADMTLVAVEEKPYL